MTAALKPVGDLRRQIPYRQAGSLNIGLLVLVNIPKIRQPHGRLNQATRETWERFQKLKLLLLPEFRLVEQPSIHNEDKDLDAPIGLEGKDAVPKRNPKGRCGVKAGIVIQRLE